MYSTGVERLLDPIRSRPTAYGAAVLEWALMQPKDGSFAVQLERRLIDALTAMNGPMFWALLWLAGHCRVISGYQPHNDDLFYLVEAFAMELRWGEERAALTTAEVADRLGCSERHVRRLAGTGALQARLGPNGTWKCARESVRNYRKGVPT